MLFSASGFGGPTLEAASDFGGAVVFLTLDEDPGLGFAGATSFLTLEAASDFGGAVVFLTLDEDPGLGGATSFLTLDEDYGFGGVLGSFLLSTTGVTFS